MWQHMKWSINDSEIGFAEIVRKLEKQKEYMCSRLPIGGTLDGWIPKMGRDVGGRRHTARQPKQQNYSPRWMFVYLYPTTRSYLTRSSSGTAQKKRASDPDFLNLHVSMNRSYSAQPCIVQPLRASQNTHVPIRQELTLGITSIPRPQSANYKMSLSCIIMSGYWTLTYGVILMINECNHSRLPRSSHKYTQCCYH